MEDECSQLNGMVNESKRTEQVRLDRISTFEKTLLSLGRERSENAQECVEIARRMRNLIFFGIGKTVNQIVDVVCGTHLSQDTAGSLTGVSW